MSITGIDFNSAMRAAACWEFCLAHGFPSKNQHPSKPAGYVPGAPALYSWTAYGPNNIRGQGDTAQDAVDHAMRQAKGLKV